MGASNLNFSCKSISHKLQLHDAIYRLRFYSNSLIHILSLSNSYNNVASLQKNRSDKSHRVIVAIGFTNERICTSNCMFLGQFGINSPR